MAGASSTSRHHGAQQTLKMNDEDGKGQSRKKGNEDPSTSISPLHIYLSLTTPSPNVMASNESSTFQLYDLRVEVCGTFPQPSPSLNHQLRRTDDRCSARAIQGTTLSSRERS